MQRRGASPAQILLAPTSRKCLVQNAPLSHLSLSHSLPEDQALRFVLATHPGSIPLCYSDSVCPVRLDVS
jgi:hypothetical protein